jgi:SsrA-binding protein
MTQPNTKKQPELNIRNKKAGFEYEFLDHYTAGIVLKGTEIKSIRLGKASINEAYCYVEKGEVFIKNMHISPYENASFYKHDPKSVRKLLLNKHEIYKIFNKVKIEGITLIPLKVFMSGAGRAKVDIAVVRGKKLYDKRQDIKEKDAKRELGRIMKK